MTFKRHRVTDREAPEVHTVERLGRTQSLTPEGFLLCAAVPIKRLGTMPYGPGETPIKVGRDGLAWVTRDAAELFTDETIASYQGKPIVNDHPPEDVTPRNWKKYSVGICLNPRRGVGDDADVMLADLLITDAATIREVQAGKREVSAGYDADYEQTGEGTGKQLNIIGNHVALVNRGRCGVRCSISDHQPSTLKGNNPMGTKTKAAPRVKLSEAIRLAFKDAGDNLADSLGGEDMLGDGGDSDGGDDDGHTHIHIHAAGDGPAPMPGADGGDPAAGDPVEARFVALEQGMQEITSQLAQLAQAISGGGQPTKQVPSTDDAPPGGDGDGLNEDANTDDITDGEGDTKPDAKKTTDSAALATSFQKLVADAEILAPGLRLITFDATATRAATIDRMCGFRRNVLGHLRTTTDGASLLQAAGGADLDIDKTPCGELANLFNTVATAKRVLNQRAAVGDSGKIAGVKLQGKALTPAEMNKANADFWAARNGR